MTSAGLLFAYTALALATFVLVGLEELPLRMNLGRAARRVRRGARRTGRDPRDQARVLARQTRWGGWILVAFSAAGAALVLYGWVAAPPRDRIGLGFRLFAAVLPLGLLFDGLMFALLGPKLLEEVRRTFDGGSATPNSEAAVPGDLHGRGP